MHADSPMSVELPLEDEDEENRTTRTNKINSNAYKQEIVNSKNEKS